MLTARHGRGTARHGHIRGTARHSTARHGHSRGTAQQGHSTARAQQGHSKAQYSTARAEPFSGQSPTSAESRAHSRARIDSSQNLGGQRLRRGMSPRVATFTSVLYVIHDDTYGSGVIDIDNENGAQMLKGAQRSVERQETPTASAVSVSAVDISLRLGAWGLYEAERSSVRGFGVSGVVADASARRM
ncbi:unnamed protein product [Lampetra fluviatilis]